MKAFVIYTALRIGLFVACYVVFSGIWILTVDKGGADLIWPFLAAVIVSAVLSYRLLRSQRERFAEQVQDRASRATRRFEEIRAREDV